MRTTTRLGGLLAWAGVWLVLALPGAGAALAAPVAAQQVLTASADGSLVIDPRSKLAWERCVVGMRWNGRNCVGSARLLTFAQARALVQERWQAEGVRWRLPRVPELRRLAVRGGAAPAGVPELFADAPGGWYWSGTSSVNATAVNPYAYDNVVRGGRGGDTLRVRHAWAVDMDTGKGRGDMDRGMPLVVRLVRPAPKP